MKESPEQSTALHPALQNALASLDLRLEDELSHYRQQRSQLALPPQMVESPVDENDSAIPKPDDLNAGGEDRSDPQWAKAEPEVTPIFANALETHHDPEQLEFEGMGAANSMEPVEPETLPDAALVNEAAEAQASVLVPTNNAERIAADEGGMIEIETPLDATFDSEAVEALNQPTEPPSDFPKSYENYLDPSIEDYLESSEALLQHLEESKAEPKAKAKPQKGTNLSGILLLLLAVLGIGGGVIWSVKQQKPTRQQPPVSSPSPAASDAVPTANPVTPPLPSPTFRLPTRPNDSPAPVPTASSVPLQPPVVQPSVSPAVPPQSLQNPVPSPTAPTASP
ncbi:MAG: hypothetical protein ACFCU8_08705 [Thermosynechococcaceae cyanobacterium]